MNGEILIIHNVSRYCDGIYECVAFNNVPPAVNKEITVLVEFSPEILLHNKRIGQVSGKETILECQITAFPQAISVWRFKGNNLMNSMKYRIDVYNDADHQITLSLRVMNITKDDFGLYTCFAENKLGRDQEGMILFDIAPVKTTSTTMKPTTTTIDHYVDYVETGEHLYKNNRHGSVHANGFEPGRPYAGHSSMGNTAVQSASPKNFITILTIILANLYYAS